MQKMIPRVGPKYLLSIAGLVWMFAGGNILRIGVPDFMDYWQSNLLYLAGAAGVFLIFTALIFYRLVQKHNTRIMSRGMRKCRSIAFLTEKAI